MASPKKNQPVSQPKYAESNKHPPGSMDASDIFDDFEPMPPVNETGKINSDDPVLRMSEDERRELVKKNEASAKAVMQGLSKPVGLDAIRNPEPAKLETMSKEQEASMQPKAYRVLEEFTFSRGSGNNSLLRRGKIINDREYDVEALRKMGAKLDPVEIPK